MSLSPLPVIDTRHLFRPVSSELVSVLRGLPPDAWHRPTLARAWVVRDIVAHLVDLAFRRVSFHRDRLTPPPPPFPIESEQDFVRFINGLNQEWVAATGRFSPAVLTELFELASTDLAAFFEALPLEAPALFGVSWAGEQTSEGWFDVGREFTELWHHQMQIRLAVGAAPLADPRYLRAALAISMRALPHVYRDVPASEHDSVTVLVDGDAGGAWTLKREADRWTLWDGAVPTAAARARLSEDAAWKLLFNALSEGDASSAARIEGRRDLVDPLLRARSVIV